MPNTHVLAAGEAMLAAKIAIIGRFSGHILLVQRRPSWTYAAIRLLLAAAGLRTRLGRATLAFVLMRLSNRLYIVGYRTLENLEDDIGRPILDRTLSKMEDRRNG